MKKLLLIATTVVLSGCLGSMLTPSYTPEIKWKEEVKLHDGRVIVVERWGKRGGRAEPGQPPMQSWEEIRTKNPDTGEEIVWQEDAASGPYVLDFVNGTPYLAVSVDLLPSCRKYKFPKINFVFFKYEEKTWKRITLEQFPKYLDTNLLLGDWKAEKLGMLDELMNLEKKETYYRRHRYSETSMRKLLVNTQYPNTCGRFSYLTDYQVGRE